MPTTTICSLPPEILIEIFLACSQNGSSLGAFNSTRTWPTNTKSTPFVLTHVCARWRHVALNTSRIWSTLQLTWSTRNIPSRREFCTMWLSRAGDSPLDLYMVDTNSHANNPVTTEEILNCILPFKDQWRHVRLVLNSSPWWTPSSLPAINKCHGNFPLLNTLELEYCNKALAKWLVLRDCPNLQRVSFNADFDMLHVDASPIPWGYVTQLVSTQFVRVDVALKFLRQYTSLTSLSITFHKPELVGEYPPITLPNIRELRLTTFITPACPFFNALTLPSLSTFVYTEATRSASLRFPTQSLCDLFQRSQPPIEKLHIVCWHSYVPSDAELTTLLEAVPQVSSFGVESSNQIFGEAIAQGIATSALVPALQVLTLCAFKLLAVSEQTLKSLAMMRKDLKIVVGPGVSKDMKAFLDARNVAL